MIDPRELRIGNIVDWCNEPREILGIDKSTLAISSGWWSNDSVDPIPLTSEWLERFGFEQHPNLKERWFANYNGHHVTFNEDGGDWNYHMTMLHPELVTGYCRYVHQLQNLFFALTGTELTLQPHN